MGQWAPFSLVSSLLTNMCIFVANFANQLGEAILTEPDPGACEPIPLADTRMPTHDPAREESDFYLDGNDEEHFGVEVNPLMGSGFARSSRPEIHDGDIGDEWISDDADGISGQEQPQTGLSGKAGVILACLSYHFRLNTFLMSSTGHQQHIHRHSAISHHRRVGDHICHL